MDENETELIENDQIHKYSESSKLEGGNNQKIQPDKRKVKGKKNEQQNHHKKNQPEKKNREKPREAKNKTKTDGAQWVLAQ